MAPTANTAPKYTSASARKEKRSIRLPSAKVATTPPTCSIDPITTASETEAPRSLRTVGSQFDRKYRSSRLMKNTTQSRSVAAALRIELRGHGDGIRHRAAKPEPGEKADDEQRGDVLDHRGGKRADAERQRAQDDDGLAPDAVGERPEHQRADHQPEQAGAEHRAQRGLREAPFLGERGCDIAYRLGVETVQEQHRRAGQKHPDLESADRLTVDEIDHVDRLRSATLSLRHRHRHPSPTFFRLRLFAAADDQPA